MVEQRDRSLQRAVLIQEAAQMPDRNNQASHLQTLALLLPQQGKVDRTSSWEAPLLNTAALQRLGAVSQLGFVERVWPQASHHRLAHSLGCYQLARQALAQFQARAAGQPTPLFSPIQSRTLLAAALLHDIGHYPFSHSLDGLRSLLPAHEQVGRALIEHGDIAVILERDYGVVPAHVADLIDPSAQQSLQRGQGISSQLLNGPCDLDKLDYVARDAQACGFSARCADPLGLLAALHLSWPATQTMPRLAFSLSARHVVRSWVMLRHLLYVHIYWHPLNRAYSAMLARAVQDALDADALTVTDLQCATDQQLLVSLTASAMPVGTRALVQLLTGERPYQPLIELRQQVLPCAEHLGALAQDARRRKYLEQQLTSRFQARIQREIAEHEVLIDILPAKRWELDGCFLSTPPSVGKATCLPWSQALEIDPAHLARIAHHHCPTRILVAPHLAPLLQAQGCTPIISDLQTILSQM